MPRPWDLNRLNSSLKYQDDGTSLMCNVNQAHLFELAHPFELTFANNISYIKDLLGSTFVSERGIPFNRLELLAFINVRSAVMGVQ